MGGSRGSSSLCLQCRLQLQSAKRRLITYGSMTVQLCGSTEPAWGELCVSEAVPSAPVRCVAAKGVGSACSRPYGALGTESARYKWLPCHGRCGIQINKTGAGISKQPLPRSSHLLCAFLWRGAGEGGELWGQL